MKKSTNVIYKVTLFILLGAVVCVGCARFTRIKNILTGQGSGVSTAVTTQTQSGTNTGQNTPQASTTQTQKEVPLSGSNSGAMKKMTVSQAVSRNAVCNDGSPAMYYIRRGAGGGSTRWLIHLQGGGFCYDAASCAARKTGQESNLMSTKQTPNDRSGSGILSPSGSDNKFFATYNEVYVAYCSSDFWSGDRGASSDTNGLNFRGADIFRAVIADLSDPSITSSPNLTSATDIILSGSSAGGAGVLVHLDWLAAKFPSATVHGINDAGWFMDIAPYDTSLPPVDTVAESAYKYWNGTVDQSCAAANPGNEGICYLGPHVYPQIKTPLFVQIAQYDGPQLLSLGLKEPISSAEKQYALQFGTAVTNSLGPVSAAFSPADKTHGLLISGEFTSVTINNLSLQTVLGNWLFNLGGPIKEIATPK